MKPYKRPNSPYWWGYYKIQGQKPRRWSLGVPHKTTSKAMATKLVLEAYEKELHAIKFGAQEAYTLRMAVERWLSEEGETDNNARNRRYFAAKLLGWEPFKGKRWHANPDLPMTRVDTAFVHRLTTERQKEGLAANSINAEIGMLRRVYNRCRNRWNVEVKPDVQFPELRGRVKTRYLSVDEEQHLLNVLQRTNEWTYTERHFVVIQNAIDMVCLLIDTGLRHMELMDLPWADVDLKAGTINVWRSKTATHTPIRMTKRVKGILSRRRQSTERPPQTTKTTRDITTWVFPQWHQPYRVVQEAIEHAGLNPDHLVERHGRLTIHSMRDTFATRLIQNGMSLKKVAKLLGHSSQYMSAKYAHLEDDEVADEAVDLLDTLSEDTAPKLRVVS